MENKNNKGVNIGVGLDTSAIATNIQQMTGQLRALVNELAALDNPTKQVGNSVREMGDKMKKASDASGIAGAAVMSFNGVIQDSNYGVRGMANNFQQLVVMMTGLLTQTKSVKLAFIELRNAIFGPLGILLAITSVITWFEKQEMQEQKNASETKKLAKVTEGLSATLTYAKEVRENYNKSLEDTKGLMIDVSNLSKKQITLELAELRKQLIVETDGLTMAEQALDDAREEGMMAAWKSRAIQEASKNEINDAQKAYDQYRGRIDAVTNAIKSYEKALKDTSSTEKTLSPSVASFKDIGNDFSGHNKAIKDLTTEMMDVVSKGGNLVAYGGKLLGTSLGKGVSDGLDESMQTIPEKMSTIIKAIVEPIDEINIRLQAMIKQFAVTSVSGFLGAIGESLVGGKDSIKKFGEDFLSEFGGFLQQVGTMILTYGFAMEAFKNAFSNPVVAIGAGAALIVLGGAIKGAHEKKFGGTSGSVPSANYGGGGTGSYGSRLQENIIYSRLDGRDLVLSNQRTGYVNSR